jgi:hypothetical protein
MITPKQYETLEKEERKLWRSHDFEATSLLSLGLPTEYLLNITKSAHVGEIGD